MGRELRFGGRIGICIGIWPPPPIWG